MLLAIPIGIVLGWLTGGSLSGLQRLRFALAPLAVGGLLVQVLLFTPAGDEIAGALAPAAYVASTAAVFVAVLRNLRLSGMPIVAVGSLSNLVAIVANGGSMPADPAALVSAGLVGTGDHTNSVVLADPTLGPLTDIFAVPAGLPFANVFSVGDVLIGLGIAVVIAGVMRAGTGTHPGHEPNEAPAVATSPDAPAGGSATGT
jgi:hypothetical protein